MLSQEGFDWTRLCSLKLLQTPCATELILKFSISTWGGNSPSEVNTVIIFLRFVKWNLNFITDLFLVIFTMIKNIMLNKTVKHLTGI